MSDVDAAREAQWDNETRRLEIRGRIVISQTPSDPGDIGEPRINTVDGITYVAVPEFELWPIDPAPEFGRDEFDTHLVLDGFVEPDVPNLMGQCHIAGWHQHAFKGPHAFNERSDR